MRFRFPPSVLVFVVGVFLLSSLVASSVRAQTLPTALPDGVTCTGHFVNPITDPCWECLFPLTLGSIPLFSSSLADDENPSSPVCICPMAAPPFIRIGLEYGFWEPVRLEDVTQKAWCFPDLGGVKISAGIGYPSKAAASQSAQNQAGHKDSAYHVHYYIYPLMYWLELFTDFLCVEQASFDIGYVTELDPTWNDDSLGALLTPETILFDNPIAQAVCGIDCVLASTTGSGSNALFWCAGCQGGMYPMVGNMSGEYGQAQGAVWAAERFLYKLHRMYLANGTIGEAAICGLYSMPIMDKHQYRLQFVNPIAGAGALAGAASLPLGDYNCPGIGVTTLVSEAGKVTPVVGEDLGFLVWRKHTCCSF